MAKIGDLYIYKNEDKWTIDKIISVNDNLNDCEVEVIETSGNWKAEEYDTVGSIISSNLNDKEYMNYDIYISPLWQALND